MHPFHPLHLLATTPFFAVSLALPFSECYTVEIEQYGAFLDWLLSFSNIYAFQIPHLLIVHFFLLLNNKYSIVCLHHNLFIYSPTEGHVGCFRILDRNKSDIIFCVQGFVWI